jgi:hypothetical protein
VRPCEDSVADGRTVFDQYIFYMKDVSRGYGVTYERFKAMLEGLGHKVVDYQDEMKVTRDKVLGLKVVVPTGA